MRKTFILIAFLFIVLLGFIGSSDQEDDIGKGAFDTIGIIKEIDTEGRRILIKSQEDGLIWITLSAFDNISRYQEGKEVVIWISGGIAESYPAQAKARNIEFTTPNQ
ncbi:MULTISPECIES: DUF3221 domain-containing protein [unclassified Bacillus (in: firmicutes)]|uniref:DUF3221 domain-containing protein n=1 Tax=unclassified Bacillus (in: firmicutes) TaxID=185979 RepID=UPI0008F29335|nr:MULTISPECIES: DUF3221 domain-containing protein [unclassified Bacillus (in: firmicutes)]SFA85435.1 Protein of unknown function [Bacillus sp. UNCCL13]SFQ83416.1 Protein of unknown function [Bacillus sp. cl95]